MKKILFFITIFLINFNICNAANNIYNIDIEVYIDEKGDANITEKWDVKGSDGSEWYKVLDNLGNSKIENFTVSMDGSPLTYKKWNIKETLSQKKGYYGINNGKELCFGKYDFNRHVFTLNYKLTNFIFNVEDAQVIYFNFIDKLSDVNFNNFSLEISSYYKFPDTLDVWGFGYKGYAYVEDGKIKMSNEGKMNNQYVVLLAKFPTETFTTSNKYSKYNNFDEILADAKLGSFSYNYDKNDKVGLFYTIITIVSSIGYLGFWVWIVNLIIKSGKYGYIDNKKINKQNTHYFRDIPCNKDIYYANALASLNGWLPNETNILGSILLKWIKMGVLTVKKVDDKNVALIVNGSGKITDSLELELYSIVSKASGDGILEKKEFEKWARKNYSKFFSLFSKIKTNEINKLKTNNHIFKRQNKTQCKYRNVMDDTLYDDSQKLYGLKLFLDDFSNIREREAIEVNLWDEYLMFAYLFGSAKKVMKQFKNMYPEIVAEMNNYNLDLDTFYILNTISASTVSAASSARSAAQSYSSGGGGFSSGGGGGGSFGGGGGGSR